MRVLVCGGRDYADAEHVNATLDALNARGPITCIVHGAASGVDTLAARWAEAHEVYVHAYPAQWKRYGKRAGPLRNADMLDDSPVLVLAFPGGRGTADMVRRAKAANVPVMEVPPNVASRVSPTEGV